MPNPWDNSQILLANNAGARLGGGIASFGDQIGGALQTAIVSHRAKKKEKEAEDAAVSWLKEKGATYFPGLNIADEGEMKAAVKAAGGGRQAIQMLSGLEAQQQQRAAAAQQKQLVDAQLAKLEQDRTDTLRRRGAARLAAGGAVKGGELEAMLRAGDDVTVPAGEFSPDSAVGTYLSRTGDVAGAGGMAKAYGALEQLRQERTPFTPELVDLGGGVTGMTTSRKSAVPVGKGEKGPLSREGKILADADALERGGRAEDAAALRKLATTPKGAGNKPMSAVDWILTGGDPTQYRSYVEGFRAESSDAPPAAAGGDGGVTDVKNQDEFNKLPKGARFRFNGKTGIKL